MTKNTREITKTIKERNIFNSDGKFPEEKFGGEIKGRGSVFDIDAPCRPTTLPIELMGTIYVGDRLKSIATVRDKTYSEADIYRVGDEIYGSEGAIVAAVERQTIVINNQGVKECIELAKPLDGVGSDGFPSVGGGVLGGSQGPGAGAGSDITLESSYVENELGPGFAKIMDAARFVPNTVDNQVNGFKLFAIRPGSLLSRVGLQNNDIVTQVNDTSLKQADQGFAFYQALQDEKEVRIQILRGGNTPMNITVRIK
jgi:general secretion pathway protein C